MKSFTIIMAVTFVLTILDGALSAVYADHASGGEGPVIAGTLGVVTLVVYDWATAHLSVKRYNESLLGMFPLRKPNEGWHGLSPAQSFGQPIFSRIALVHSYMGSARFAYFDLPTNHSKNALESIPFLFAERDMVYRPRVFAQTPRFSRAVLLEYDSSPVVYSPDRADKQLKSPATATLLSLGATLLPIAVGALIAEQSGTAAFLMISSGVIIGPSTGHWYAKRTSRGLITSGLRLGLGLLVVFFEECCT